MSELGTIRLTQHIAHPVERVWEALTDPALLAKWWAPGDISPEIGHRFTLDMGAFGKQSCQVLAAEPPRLFAYTFGEGMLGTTITWRLEDAGDGTDLTLEHAGFDLDSEMGRRAHQGMGAGWPSLLAKIEPVLDGAE